MSIPHKPIMNASQTKRKPFVDVSNTFTSYQDIVKKRKENEVVHMMPDSDCKLPSSDIVIPKTMYLQNLHPALAMYKDDLVTDFMSFSDLQRLCDYDNEMELITFLTGFGVLPKQQQCLLCGSMMRLSKQVNTTYWICTKRVNGKKCNSAKFSIRKGTFFDNSKLPIQSIVRIVWNFLHHLSVDQCKSYVAISTKTNHTVVEYYADCRSICNSWIWNPINTPKLGGFGKIVEMDESYFPGQSKYKRGRNLGTSWETDEKWVFGLTERDSLDCILTQVPSSRTRKNLIPIINKHCKQGSLFCSDGWKAYFKLAEHLDLEDVLHYSVKHSKNYVDADTGAHTQTIAGLWGHVKDFLPIRGMKPKDLNSYLGWFMWTRYCKQRKLDLFVHFLRCVADIRPPSYIQSLPNAKLVSSIIKNTESEKGKCSDDEFM